jgi:hypothetical protein
VLKERFKPMLPVQAPIQRANEPLPTNLQIQPSSDEAKLNKLEAAWFDVLRSRRPDWIGIEPFGLKLAAARCRYHPDFITLQNGQLTAWETKGKWFTDDGKVKLKVAAREYPFIRFVLVTRDKTGWTESEVKP